MSIGDWNDIAVHDSPGLEWLHHLPFQFLNKFNCVATIDFFEKNEIDYKGRESSVTWIIVSIYFTNSTFSLVIFYYL